jgi:hypothetical protein
LQFSCAFYRYVSIACLAALFASWLREPLLAAASSAAFAEPLTFDAAIERASRDAPSIRAGEAEVEATRSASVAAGRLPDPTLNLGLDCPSSEHLAQLAA